MSYSEYLQKLIFLAELLEKEKTGTAGNLAKKLDVSRRTVFRHLDELRENGADISYSKSKKSYVLKNKFDLWNLFSKSAMKWHSD
jgi:predicted DNA-binding transcriptional regulator YafY